MEITGTESARKKQSNFENSLNRFADKCPLSGGKADMTLCGNPLSRSLSGVKRTCRFALHMSAFDPKRTFVAPCAFTKERLPTARRFVRRAAISSPHQFTAKQ